MSKHGTSTRLGWQSSARHFGPPPSSSHLITFIGPTGHLTKPSGGTDLKRLKGLVLAIALLGMVVAEAPVAGAAAADLPRGGPSPDLMAHHLNNIMDLIYSGQRHRLEVNSPETNHNFAMTRLRRPSQLVSLLLYDILFSSPKFYT